MSSSSSSVPIKAVSDSTSGDNSRANKRQKVKAIGQSGGQSRRPALNESDVKLLSQFECPVCLYYISPPILQCLNGHVICRDCYRKVSPKCPTCRENMPTEDNRNLALEQKAVNLGLRFPCKHRELGCQVTNLLREKSTHEQYCQYEPYKCPKLFGHCDWSGSGLEMVEHLNIPYSVQNLCYGSRSLYRKSTVLWLLSLKILLF